MTVLARRPRDHADVELRLTLDMLRRGLWVVPVAAAVLGIFRGFDGGLAALLGGALVTGNFLLSALVLSRAARISVQALGVAAMFSFLLRLLLLGAVLYLLVEVLALDRVSVLVASVASYLVLLVLESVAVARGTERRR